MLQTRKIRENKAEYIKLLKVKNFDANNIFNLLIDLDDQRKEAQIKCDELLSKSNNLSSQIGKLYKTGDTNKVFIVKDNMTTTPSVDISSATLEEETNGGLTGLGMVSLFAGSSPARVVAVGRTTSRLTPSDPARSRDLLRPPHAHPHLQVRELSCSRDDAVRQLSCSHDPVV